MSTYDDDYDGAGEQATQEADQEEGEYLTPGNQQGVLPHQSPELCRMQTISTYNA